MGTGFVSRLVTIKLLLHAYLTASLRETEPVLTQALRGRLSNHLSPSHSSSQGFETLVVMASFTVSEVEYGVGHSSLLHLNSFPTILLSAGSKRKHANRVNRAIVLRAKAKAPFCAYIFSQHKQRGRQSDSPTFSPR